MVDCPADYCQNEGICAVEVDQPQTLRCFCQPGYSGEQCMDGTLEAKSFYVIHNPPKKQTDIQQTYKHKQKQSKKSSGLTLDT